MWSKTHSPADYVQAFHTPFLEGPGQFAIAMSLEEKDVRREGKRFNAFKASLGRFPLHRTSQRALKLTARVSYELEGEVWGAWVTTTWNSTMIEELAGTVLQGERI